MSNRYSLVIRRADGSQTRQGDLSKAQATAAARGLRAAGIAAFVFPTACLNLLNK